ncbi:hypothetical protein Plec18167_005055 [Paecilomyces lecythidis]|uniref:Uncharacterized protein n=1 Tax=Paecilomyces lecythidis TaxID=3004212 RepID=A0ABR3XL11_9EURO
MLSEHTRLFLDLSPEALQNDTTETFEHWSGEYANALYDRRFGDAIWARYNLAGDVQNDTSKDARMAVFERIKEDALKYRISTPEQYTDALLLYGNTSVEDQHTDVIDMIKRIGRQNITETKAELGDLSTWSIRCDRSNLAYDSSCQTVLNNMPKSKQMIGTEEDVDHYGSCHLRVSKYRGSSTDLTYYRAHAVAMMIAEECAYVPAGSTSKMISGWSPGNTGHRKVCLSSKDSGCR